MTSKQQVAAVFDDIAAARSWESLYEGRPDRISYNFVTRQRAVEELLEGRVPEAVLDLGCGTGDLLRFFAQHDLRYVGVDYSAEMVARAQRLHAQRLRGDRVCFERGDSEALPFDDASFPLLTAVALLEYFAEPAPTLDEIGRVVAPGGLALVTVPHKSCWNFRVRDWLAPLRRLLFPLYVRWSGAPLTRMAQVAHRAFDPEELHRLMAARGFEPIDERYTNFYFVPHPLDHLLARSYMRLSEWADRSGRGGRFRCLAANYIALYRKSAG